MFRYQTTIHLFDTDATGVLYFAHQFRLALEALEHALKSLGYTLARALEEANCYMPIVNATADYYSPLVVGDAIVVVLKVEKRGTSSFTLRGDFFLQGNLVGRTSIVHVTVDRETRKAIPIPPLITGFLQELERGE